jgi:hypothetical protein
MARKVNFKQEAARYVGLIWFSGFTGENLTIKSL